MNWIACAGRGLCHEVAPELVALDPWGYPLLRDAGDEPLSRRDRRLAKEAAATCPVQALRGVGR